MTSAEENLAAIEAFLKSCRQPALLDVNHGQVMPCLVALEAGVQTAEMRPFPPVDEL